jgi:site-specific DNA-methyltransferase (adenine-specific)
MDLTRVFNCDCLLAMREFPDKYFELAIVDPPYGIGESSGQEQSRNQANGRAQTKVKYKIKTWDNSTPDETYFSELFRVSKDQIIWGANHFGYLAPASCWIVWDKDNSGDFADCELAWTSFDTAVRKFKYRWNGMLQENMRDKEERIHPTQKPVALYKWLLKNYAKEGDKILDTHLGSQSSRIAAFDMGFEFTGYELDKDYFEAGNKRFNQHKSQLKLFS